MTGIFIGLVKEEAIKRSSFRFYYPDKSGSPVLEYERDKIRVEQHLSYVGGAEGTRDLISWSNIELFGKEIVYQIETTGKASESIIKEINDFFNVIAPNILKSPYFLWCVFE